MSSLNEVFARLSMRRRYEAWFVRLGLADGRGAWWFRYLLLNPGRSGCEGEQNTKPVQVWATWFPAVGQPQTFIQGFPLGKLDLSKKNESPFHFRVDKNTIEEDSCSGALELNGHNISWNMHYHSLFRVTLSNKGWIGFSRTPHSDATFSGEIQFDEKVYMGEPLGFGLQGHNCGYRHRSAWAWAHAHIPLGDGNVSTLEALMYDMPFGLLFRKAVFWHRGRMFVFKHLQTSVLDQENLRWSFECANREIHLTALFDGHGAGTHRIPYVKTDCTGTFAVLNNSLSSAVIIVEEKKRGSERLSNVGGSVLEMGGLCQLLRPR